MVDSAPRRPPTLRGLTLTLLGVVGCFLAATPTLAQGNEKLDPLLRLRARALLGRSRVIVEFEPQREGPLTVSGAIAGRSLPGGRSQALDIDNRGLERLAADPRIRRVIADRPAFATLERAGAAVGANAVRDELGLTGAGIGIAVIDSGVTPFHNDLELRRRGRTGHATIAHFKDFTTEGGTRASVADTPTDDYGHGTHVAGIIAGSGYDSNGQRMGMAPGAHLVVLRVLDGNGQGYVSDVIAAIDYAIAVKAAFNIRVINLSVASGVFESYSSDPLAQAARRAVNAGMVVVASAGNLGQTDEGAPQHGGITSPGNAPWVLTVGAASHQGTADRQDDRVAAFSSMGPTWIDFAAKPDVLAYGVGIESTAAAGSTLATKYPQFLVGGAGATGPSYLSLSGTSMATPAVAATVALMLEANSQLTPNAVKALLEYSAESRATSTLAEGAGLLNARGAVRLAASFGQPGGHIGPTGDVIAGRWVPWSQHVLWGNLLLDEALPPPTSLALATAVDWGALTAGNGPVWGASASRVIVWRGDTPRGRGDVWGAYADDNIVWSTYSDDNIVWSTYFDDNIVWSTYTDDNIVWSTRGVTNVVWAADCRGRNCRGALWGDVAPNGETWGAYTDDNIVWSTYFDDNIVWSTYDTDDNIVWSTVTDVRPVRWPSRTDRRGSDTPARGR